MHLALYLFRLLSLLLCKPLAGLLENLMMALHTPRPRNCLLAAEGVGVAKFPFFADYSFTVWRRIFWPHKCEVTTWSFFFFSRMSSLLTFSSWYVGVDMSCESAPNMDQHLFPRLLVRERYNVLVFIFSYFISSLSRFSFSFCNSPT